VLIVAAALLGLAVGLLTGGGLRNLLARRLRWPLVVIAAFLVRELIIRTPLSGSPWAPAIFTVSLAVLVAWTAWHRGELPGIWLVTAGIAMNLLVVLANGGRMPVVASAVGRGPRQLAQTGVWAGYAVMGPGTRLGWLGDWILLPPPLGRLFPEAYSPGDLVSAVGLAVVLLVATRPRRRAAPTEVITTR
jgi:hypothetical protein